MNNRYAPDVIYYHTIQFPPQLCLDLSVVVVAGQLFANRQARILWLPWVVVNYCAVGTFCVYMGNRCSRSV